MNKYKYFFKTDNSKEAIGIVEAIDYYLALKKAAAIKKLSLTEFADLFKVELFNETVFIR